MARQVDIDPRDDAQRRLASDRVIAQLARGQHAMVSRDQLLGAGLTRGQIQIRLAREMMRSLYRGVYIVGPMPPTSFGRWIGATLALRGSVLSHRSAAELWGLVDPMPGPVHVLKVGGGSRSQPDLCTHRAVSVPEAWLSSKARIPVVTPMFAAFQVAARLGPVGIKRMLERAEQRQLLDVRSLKAILTAHPNATGRRRLLVALSPFRRPLADTRSTLEIRFLRACHERGLPIPATNVPVDRFEVDFFWPDAGLVVETDGFEPHGTRSAFDRDRKRWARLVSLGFVVMSVTDNRLNSDADRLFEEIGKVLAGASRH